MDEALLAGYRRFRTSGWPERRAVFERLAAEGQHPRAMVIGCVDSRVDASMILDAGPGELLTVRNVANLVPPYAPDVAYHGTSAALEFAVRVLEVPSIIVLGHGMCGGVRALLQGAPEGARDFVAPWMSMATGARTRALAAEDEEERQRLCELEVVKTSIRNLMTFPWIAERAAAGKLTVEGAWFAIHSGVLMVLGKDGEFAPA